MKVTKLIQKNAAKLDLKNHLNIHPVIHVLHIKLFMNQPEDIGRFIPEKPALMPVIEVDEHIVERF